MLFINNHYFWYEKNDYFDSNAPLYRVQAGEVCVKLNIIIKRKWGEGSLIKLGNAVTQTG